MAELLYRLGKFSAKRAWIVITAWVLILAGTVTAMVVSNGKLSSATTIAGTPSQRVIDELKVTFPAANRGNGQVVFQTLSGKPFTAAQKTEIAAALNQVAKGDAIDSVVNPFKVELDRAKQLKKLTDGEQKIIDGQKKIDDGQKKLTSGVAEIAANETKLNKAAAQIAAGQKKVAAQLKQVEAGIAQLTAANAPAAAFAQLDAGLKQLLAAQDTLNANAATVSAGQAKLASAKADLPASQQKLVQGQKDLDKAKAQLAVGKRLSNNAKDFVLVSKDGTTAIASVLFTKPLSALETPQKLQVVNYFDAHKIAGVDVNFSQALLSTGGPSLGLGESVGLGIAAIVLFVMLGTFIGAGLPVLNALMGVGISATITMAMASVIDITSSTPVLGVMLGLAVGIDYALFILNRHRRQLKAGMEIRESIGLATGTSGNAVVFAGLTVIIALVALNLSGIGFLGIMGDAGALSVAVAVLLAITFTPAVISRMGSKVLSKKERAALANLHPVTETADLSKKQIKQAIAEAEKLQEKHRKEAKKTLKRQQYWPARHPIISILAVTVVLLTLGTPLTSMRLGLPDGASEPVTSSQYKSFMQTTKAFGAGANGMIVAVAELPERTTGDALNLMEANIGDRIAALSAVKAVVPSAVSGDHTKVLFQVQPIGGPNDISTTKLVNSLRSLSNQLKADYGVTLGITGITASNIDVSKKLADALPLYLVTILILSMLLLILVFRSILVPVVASAGFLLTVVATLGSVVGVYQLGYLSGLFDVHNPEPILSFLPIIVVGIVFGLAMDYQLFLVSGMREAYVHGANAKLAVIRGVHSGRAVVTAAAIIMITVFGGFAFSEMAIIRPMGLGLAMGVLTDAFLVRLVLVPAAMTLLGESAWWLPKWLGKILPDVDVEGAKLERTHHL